MDEKELMELSEEIIESLTKLVLGESPGFLSNSVFKKLNSNKHFDEIKALYSSFIVSFEGQYNDASELKKLSDFRYKIVELYQSGI
jgi:poly-beta-hydroxyalkanoate depolymerase